jgi:exodeoxyribonuclease VII large subunit
MLDHLNERAGHAVRRRLEHRRTQLVNLIGKYGFERLQGVFEGWRSRIGELDRRSLRGLNDALGRCRMRFERLDRSYVLRDVPRRVRMRHDEVRALGARLDGGVVRSVHDRRRHLSACADQLRALSPRLVLERGYCLARGADGTVMRSAAQLTIGDRLRLEFARGDADARVEAVRPQGGA